MCRVKQESRFNGWNPLEEDSGSWTLLDEEGSSVAPLEEKSQGRKPLEDVGCGGTTNHYRTMQCEVGTV